ncbi:methyl-accepting chemotaxis protein, partial [bacterium]|nr:methyl-accepting chemotaxis protein [bacterium]
KASWQLVSSRNRDQITSIKENQITQLIAERDSHLAYLDDALKDNAKLKKKLESLQISIESVDQLLIHDEQSIHLLKVGYLQKMSLAKMEEEKVKQIALQLSKGYEALTTLAQILKVRIQSSLRSQSSKQTQIISVIGIFAIFMGFLIAYIVIKRILVPLNLTVEAAKKLALGDVDQSIEKVNDDEFGQLTASFNDLIEIQKSRAESAENVAMGDLSITVEPASEIDKLGISLETMIESLNSLVSDVKSVSQNVNQGSENLEYSNGEISDQLIRQAACMEEISSSIGNIGEEGSKVAEIARTLKDFGGKLKEVADNGGKAMGEIVDAMQNIKSSSNAIHKIIKLIDDIAFQTNLLSLNASVEAARAGIHGKGFAVVADEVRNLATRSTSAVRESEAVIEKSMLAIRDGEKVTTVTLEVFSKLQKNVEQVIDLSESLESMSISHSTGVHQINDAINDVNDTIQSTVAQVQSALTGAKDLSNDSRDLIDMVSKFELKEGFEKDNVSGSDEELSEEEQKLLADFVN